MQHLHGRFMRIGTAGAADTLPIAEGGRADYLALKAHHYRAGNPATFSRVLVMRDAQPGAADRYLSREPVARPVAVLVESMPALACTLRAYALRGRYSGLSARQCAALLNREVRCISRVVVDPRWRGLGLAVALVRHALATAGTRYTEALAVMGRVSPFFDRAGMTAYERPALPVDQRALDALCYAGLEAGELASAQAIKQRIEALDAQTQRFLMRELASWYRAAGGRSAARDAPLDDILRAAGTRLLARPTYYLHENTHVRS